MIDPKLLEILCCPETKQDVTLADPKLIEKINKAIKEGKVKNRAGKEVKEKIDGGLIRDDKKYLYPIKEDIPIMLIEEAIPLDDLQP
ncbi:MAG: hypothetical protein N2053_05120 [Chitinispirillaceae bacterium]|nr:hypothetical protein [Chitinispirillaceae bacterium]